MSKHHLTGKQRIWHALRIVALDPLSIRELSMLTGESTATIQAILYTWERMGLLNIAKSQPNFVRRGRPPLVYSLIDRTVVNPPT